MLMQDGTLDPIYVDKLSEAFSELWRLHDGLGSHWAPEPETAQGITPYSRDRAMAGHAEVRKNGAVYQIPTLVKMRRGNQIDMAEEKAGLMFAQDFAGTFRVSGLISSIYGKSSRPRGHDSLPTERLTPEEERSFRYCRFMDACKAIGHGPSLEAVLLLICEIADSSAADVGRNFIPYKQQQQAQAVGTTLIKVGLQRLAKFYGLST